eukprot:gene7311-biopygen7115
MGVSEVEASQEGFSEVEASQEGFSEVFRWDIPAGRLIQLKVQGCLGGRGIPGRVLRGVPVGQPCWEADPTDSAWVSRSSRHPRKGSQRRLDGRLRHYALDPWTDGSATMRETLGQSLPPRCARHVDGPFRHYALLLGATRYSLRATPGKRCLRARRGDDAVAAVAAEVAARPRHRRRGVDPPRALPVAGVVEDAGVGPARPALRLRRPHRPPAAPLRRQRVLAGPPPPSPLAPPCPRDDDLRRRGVHLPPPAGRPPSAASGASTFRRRRGVHLPAPPPGIPGASLAREETSG